MHEKEEQQRLAAVIRHWNNNRLDLFEISQPDKNLEFYGVIRFYLQDKVGGTVATKCLRVGSRSTSREIIETLSEKFRPDMKMLSSSFCLYEVHACQERRLDLNERPLIIQLNWNSDNREGRFVLSLEAVKANCIAKKEKGGVLVNFKRTLSRKEKKKTANDEAGNQRSPEKTQNQNSNSVSAQQRPSDPALQNKGSLQPNCLDQLALPVEIKISHGSEEAFVSAVIDYTNSSTVHFKLSPAYVLYAAGRSAMQLNDKDCSVHTEQTHRATAIINKMVTMTEKVIEKQQTSAWALAFWMANTSELLNFIKRDKELSPLSQHAQVELSHLVHRAYKFLIRRLQNELRKHLPTFFLDPEQHGALPVGLEMVLNTLMNAMALLRRSGVNPALTVQLFSQLFHYVSAWLFNRLLGPEACSLGLRSHYWGTALRQRLTAIEGWAERQGLELAADCHLGHIIQATVLLTMNKSTIQDAKDIQKVCFKLNSLQLRTLLTSYLYASTEPHIPPALIDSLVSAAKTLADTLVESEGRGLEREESLDLQLPFLLPEGGYTCDKLGGIPTGFREFLEPICRKGLCKLLSRPNCKCTWTAFFSENKSQDSTPPVVRREPEIIAFTLRKPLNSAMGVSIVAARGLGQGQLGIYIKSIVKGGPAEMGGMLNVGDQLLGVNGQSLVGLNQDRAVGIMLQTGPVVTLQVAKHAASCQGLESLINHPGYSPNAADSRPGCSQPSGKALLPYNSTAHHVLVHTERHGTSRGKREQTLQRNRQLYRSNPNMADCVAEEGEDSAEPGVSNSHVPAVSTINLCSETFQREYLTLPSPRYQEERPRETDQSQQMLRVSLSPLAGHSSNQSTVMCQALSQQDPCSLPPPSKQNHGRQQIDPNSNHTSRGGTLSSYPLRPSVSSDNLLSEYNPTQRRDAGRSGAGVWRTPTSRCSKPTPSIQPIRIDIPIGRPVAVQARPAGVQARPAGVQARPVLISFQQNSIRMGQSPKENGHAPMQRSLHHSARLQARPAHDRPAFPTKIAPPPRYPAAPGQSQRPSEPGATLGPTKHVSFQSFPTQRPGPKKQDPPPREEGEEASSGDGQQGPSPDPWRREARERLEEQQRRRVVELLEQEVQELEGKPHRSQGEEGRLRRLSLEWQFQKRLKELQENGDEDEDEDEDEVKPQMMDNRPQDKGQAKEIQNSETAEPEEMKDKRRTMDDIVTRDRAPETLPFKERQRLFFLVTDSPTKGTSPVTSDH